ncbi:hypothetical protein HZU40_08145 [Mycolicibacterium fluoranthenivorans]|uniref:Uncharacterized protein n=1 Tax=Mycolicibacterium fluoranthenivorans TaxID=258505 RepID=A0A1G4WGJ8_9MYCO|nr:hypothetical protein [Mycolicibacterium fluoranthenivorans]MCV7356605.1 hypothetical protein [Mycolicibacterium fluoranthenivorans]NIH93997.1 hypothetical protein [Mycolicibacterium fluoranthenivorans]QNJ94233.1 hypothetical protein HZU40_08145 [Mycolicibacterium fluoranthenivorans]SCX22604.1 hypothetical protein SAMN02799620_03320 [Mycolicibacterium fluoranthenivorans]
MSRDNAAKKARRKKRQAAHRISTAAFEQVAAIEDAVVADLAEFDERITLRGWIFDEEESNDDYAVWFFEPSGAQVADGLPVTSLWLDATEDGAIVRVVLVGTTTQHPFTHDQLFEHLQVIEDYRNGDPVPEFG